MLLGCVLLTPAALLTPFRAQYHRPQQRGRQLAMQVSSPFDEKEAEAPARVTGPLDLTEENVELVLDGMRPYLIADGGNVALRDIDGGVVILELQGACGSCPSSSVSAASCLWWRGGARGLGRGAARKGRGLAVGGTAPGRISAATGSWARCLHEMERRDRPRAAPSSPSSPA